MSFVSIISKVDILYLKYVNTTQIPHILNIHWLEDNIWRPLFIVASSLIVQPVDRVLY